MLIIGERINATRKQIGRAIADRDGEAIAAVARAQADAGADVLDVNGGDPVAEREIANIEWLIDVVQSAVDVPLAVDTAGAAAMRKGLARASGRAILNSISLERQRLADMLPLVGEVDCRVVALLMSDDGPPSGVDDRLRRAGELVGKLTSAGRQLDDIFVDPCVLPVSADTSAGVNFVRAVERIRAEWPDIHIVAGLSNVSFGLPQRRWVNAALLAQAVFAGMDAAILDPCTEGLIATALASDALAGRDEFCMNYVAAQRAGKLG